MASMQSAATFKKEDEIDPLVLRTKVSGRHLRGVTLEDCLAPTGTLLVFLRHFGCTFCRDTVAKIRELSRVHRDAGFPDVIFVHQGSVREGEEFFSERWPEAAAIADPARILYRSFAVERGNALQLFGPRVLFQGLQSLLKGQGIGPLMGDPLLMPGLFLIREGRLLWHHDFKDIADRPEELVSEILNHANH